MDYAARLERAMAATPDFTAEHDRLDVPEPTAQRDGAFTRLTNLGDIADALSRDAEHVHSIIQRELGTAGQFEGEWARYNGNFSPSDFQEALDAYVAEFVTCSECGLPDTKLVMENRNRMLRCEACGAFRPVKKRSSATKQRQQEAVEEGRTYEVEITGTGRKGDGTAERGKYTMFVPGAQEGDVCRVYVENVSGTLAFTRRVE
ncbi:translation initiation factor IF-2 subunit beta [Halocalculus aciditolerans]|uniref:Translation initiation factor IF-2 subunit beta n=1 Tax=Halocalculus aciditolerans TaxID=1383812 RepID=A0A830FM43_9EURY|nr:translation initiation factor IF-2 subunit beta [Halocalculus aciditolerans]GGL69371.1 translation initiation factor IF-2 subunit beta [Halocalculus aciditolerans]